ncbi:MAG: TPM domain-containing protein, partial [Acidobacteriaceae bacterium]|nr:TPM domain-containing protein [Acidobacteriaceae bacterium]
GTAKYRHVTVRLSAGHYWILVCAIALCLGTGSRAEKISDIHPTGYVTDLAGVVDASTTQRLEALCAEVERKSGAQIAVVTVHSLEGETKETYSVDLFKHLGVGHKDNRGVLLLLAPKERQYRIEVGYGLEPVINDARAGDIGREMVPLLRQNDYSGAVALAVGRLAALIAADRGVTLDSSPPQPAHERPVSTQSPWWLPIVVTFGIFIIIRGLSRAIRGGTRRGPSFWWLGPWGGWGGGFGGSSGGFSGGGGFGGFGGGSSGGGGAGGSW